MYSDGIYVPHSGVFSVLTCYRLKQWRRRSSETGREQGFAACQVASDCFQRLLRSGSRRLWEAIVHLCQCHISPAAFGSHSTLLPAISSHDDKSELDTQGLSSPLKVWLAFLLVQEKKDSSIWIELLLHGLPEPTSQIRGRVWFLGEGGRIQRQHVRRRTPLLNSLAFTVCRLARGGKRGQHLLQGMGYINSNGLGTEIALDLVDLVVVRVGNVSAVEGWRNRKEICVGSVVEGVAEIDVVACHNQVGEHGGLAGNLVDVAERTIELWRVELRCDSVYLLGEKGWCELGDKMIEGFRSLHCGIAEEKAFIGVFSQE